MKLREQPDHSTSKLDQSDPAESLNAARIMARALAAAHPDEERLSLARSFCFRLVAAWWRVLSDGDESHSLRPLLQPLELEPLPEPAAASADSIGHAAAACPPESAVYAIGMTYIGMLPQAFRAQNGVYYTPPPLTARLIEQAGEAGVDWSKARVLDPACGGGAFLAPVAQKILDALPNVTPSILVKNISSRLRGYEIDPFAAWLSQVTLDAVMLPICRKAGRKLPVVVSIGDSLQRSPPRERFDLVIGNPPYGRVRLDPEERVRFRRSLFGHANLYGLFTDLALRHVKSDGLVAYVTPTSFLAGEYFKNLRTLLGKQAPPVCIDLVAARKGVFEDVLQETLLATYKKSKDLQSAPVHEVMPIDAEHLQITKTGCFHLPTDPSKPWLMPRSPEQASLIDRLQSFESRLFDWGYGVSTGPLVWNRFKNQLCSRKGKGRYPLIWAEAVTADGRFVFRAEKRNHQPYFAVKERDGWLVTRSPCVLLQRTTAKEQNRRLIAAPLPKSFLTKHGAVVIENHLNMLRPLASRPAISPSVLAAFLNSEAADRAFRCISGSVAVSAYELESLPLPPVNSLRCLSELVRRRASRDDIEAECSRLFEKDETV
ncbi:MAG: N-6 DNA methylase [Pseudomonadota bacterium]